MPLKNINNEEPEDVKQNIEALKAQTMGKIQRGDRTPNSSDNGDFFIKQTPGSATVIFYIRDTISGVWRAVTLS